MAMAVEASVLSGSTNLMAMGHPFAGPTGPHDPETGAPIGGVPIMIDIRTREVIVFDPWLLKQFHIIHSAFGIVLGPKGHGKSSLLKILANRLSLLTAGYDTIRMSINDYKPEESSSEYALFTKHMRSKVFEIASMRVNPFESRLFVSPDDEVHDLAILRIAEILFEFVNNVPATGANAEALRIGVAKMLTRNQLLWSPELLFDSLRTLDDSDITSYETGMKTRLQSQMKTRLEHINIESETVRGNLSEQMQMLNMSGSNLRYEEIKQAGIYMSQQLGNIIHGSYGGMFGADHSLYDMLTQRTVTKDWRGASAAAETLMRILDTEIKLAAIEKNRLDLLPHIELDDEKHKSMGNLVYARSHSHFSEIARGTHTCSLSATHRLRSIRRGGMASELYDLGNTIIDNLGFAFIGKHEINDPGLGEICERYDLSETDKGLIPMLPDYTFGVKLGNQRIRYGRVFALPSEMKFLGTDSATGRMVDRPGVLYPEQLERFARENGIVYIGADSV
jgi:hypothetical protein